MTKPPEDLVTVEISVYPIEELEDLLLEVLRQIIDRARAEFALIDNKN